MKTAIWWIRRDLRLKDNHALCEALAAADMVLPVFVLDPFLLAKAAEKRRAFLFDGLHRLDRALRERGSYLVLRQGSPLEELSRLVAESGATAIYAEEDISPYARRRDSLVASVLPLHFVHGVTAHHPAAVRKPDGEPYTVFTPFSRMWKVLPLPVVAQQVVQRIVSPEGISSLPLPEVQPLAEFPAGEAEAARRLEQFLDGAVYAYASARDRLDLDGTSALSPYFRFGMVSARSAVTAVLRAKEYAPDGVAKKGCETWLNELIWREFYYMILYAYPQVLNTAFKSDMRAIPWRNSPEELDAWKAGKTGYPLVDAAMRQLASIGWMHNRARMVVASFLSKDLLINWQEGERWFMRQLVDGDPASNNGGWQWSAGVGTDAAPYFRIFNPILQGKKFDPQGIYIRRWLPELAFVPEEYLHEPWRMPLSVQHASGCVMGKEYPYPIVDRSLVRERTLAAYRAGKDL
ncbi:MAG: deoxyribodipyrimidine photo-lyase [Anaerolineae bacterium]|nr:deoxyribodipyrimidine photo-lyase [Anaerolineae bacterium]